MAYEVKAVLSASAGGFVSGFKEAQSALESFSNSSNTKVESVGRVMKSAGKAMTVGLTAPLVALGVTSTKSAAQFDTQMRTVQAIAGATANEFDSMRSQALQLGADTVFSASEVAVGMQNMSSAGFTASETMAAMAGVMDLAAVAGGDVGVASEIAATTVRQFGLEAGETARVADVLAEAANRTNADVAGMGDAMKYVGPVASAMGLSLENTAAAIGIMSDAGIKGGQAGTVLRSSLTRLANPTKEAQTAMTDLGMSFFDAQGQMLPLEGIVGQLQTGLAGMTSEQKAATLATIFGQEAMSGMLALMEAGPEKIKSLTDSFTNSEGAAKEFADTVNGGLGGALEEMSGAIDSAKIAIGTALAPVIQSAAEKIGQLVDKFNSLTPAQQQFVVGIAAVLAAIGPLLIIFGSLVMSLPLLASGFGMLSAILPVVGGAFTFLISPIGLVVAGITAVVATIMYLWTTNEGFRNAITTGWQAIQSVVSSVSGAIVSVVKSAWDGMKNVISTVMSAIQGDTDAQWQVISTLIQVALTVIQTVVSGGWNIVQSITNTILGALSGVVSSSWESVKSAVSSAMDNIKSTVSSKWESVKSATVSALSAMVSGVTSGMANVVSAISSGMEGALSAVTGFVGQFQSVGSNIVNAVASGISAGASAAISAAASMARAALNAAKSALGIHSPSREFLEVGSQVVAGLVKGIDGNARKAIQSTHAMGLDVLNSMPTMSFDVGGKVSSLSSLPQQMVSLSVDKNRNQGGQSASIVLNLGNRAYQAFVGDITKQQDSTADLIATYS